jgi:flagellar hook-associated protein 3 FlgL
MITGLNAANEQFLASMNTLQASLDNANLQLASGLRVNQASDAPQEIQDIFETRAAIGQSNQFIQNLTSVQTQVTTADSSVQSAIQLLEQAITLGTQGASSTSTPAEQATLALQVQGLEAQLVSLSNTQVDGVYIFSGDASGSPSYQVDLASPTGVDRLVNAPSTQQIADPTGVTFQVSMTAQDLFDQRDVNDNPTAANAFAALNSLNLALQSGNTANITTAIGSLQTADAYVNQQLGFYGATENRISSSLNLAQKFQLQDQATLSNLEDANIPAEALAVTQATTNLNAAMAAEAKRPTTTLFDFLPQG